MREKIKWFVEAYKLYRGVRTPESYADFVGIAGLMPRIAQSAGAYPQGPDGGWRYDFMRRPVHDKLLKKYDLDVIAGQGAAFERALRVMDWLCAHTYYNGMSLWTAALPDNGLSVLRYVYDKPFKRAINCWHKALVLADCLIAVGIVAMPIGMISQNNCHYTVHVWLPEEQRWAMLDPSFNAYITGETGRALNLIEIHECHRNNKEMHVAQYHLNGTQDCRETYLSSFILGSLQELLVCNDAGNKRSGLQNCLVPEGVTIRDNKLRAITATELLAEPKLI